jgi:hypothetical protein
VFRICIRQTFVDSLNRKNTLWIGDSTGRQDYQTMFSLMHGENITDDNVIGFDRDKTFLNKNINKSKGGGEVLQPHHCPARIIPEELAIGDFGRVSGTDQNCSIATTEKQPTTDGSPWSRFAMKNQATGKFDLIVDVCLKNTISQVEERKKLFQREYSVMVFSQGIWEVTRPLDCSVPNVTVATMVTEVLDDLRALTSAHCRVPHSSLSGRFTDPSATPTPLNSAQKTKK